MDGSLPVEFSLLELFWKFWNQGTRILAVTSICSLPPPPPRAGWQGGLPNRQIQLGPVAAASSETTHALARYFSSFFFQRVVAALLARADRWAAVSDAAAFLPPLLPRSARYFLIAAGSRFAMSRA